MNSNALEQSGFKLASINIKLKLYNRFKHIIFNYVFSIALRYFIPYSYLLTFILLFIEIILIEINTIHNKGIP